MIWLNLQTSVIRAPEYVGADPTQRATWFNVLAYSCEQENAGRIAGAKTWKDRQWQQTCGVTQSEVSSADPLLSWDGDDLVVWAYPASKEWEVRAKREAGRRGGQSKSQAKTKAVRENGAKHQPKQNLSTDQSRTKAEPKQNLSSNLTEGKGREGKGMESNHTFAPDGAAAELVLSVQAGEVAKPTRERDAAFDALATACGCNPREMTRPDARACAVAAADIRRVMANVDGAEIARRAANYRLHMPDCSLTPSALAKHWAKCASGPTNHKHANSTYEQEAAAHGYTL